MLGEYYVHCGSCHTKVFNSDAFKNQDGFWECKKHRLDRRTPMRTRIINEKAYAPKIVRTPAKFDVSGQFNIYWNTWLVPWELNADNWEEIG